MSRAGSVRPLAGWGRYPVAECRVARMSRPTEAPDFIADTPELIARGCGRSYGDSSLNPDLTVVSLGADRLLSLDDETGVLECEAGVRLADLIDVILPRGWFVPVTPGTKFVTIGGMIAADVHGKNHHIHGSFCDHLEWLDLALADGHVVRCSPSENTDLFHATCGGMGLTGIILRSAFRLIAVETAMIRQRTLRARGLDEAMDQLEGSLDWTYSVAWIDCLAQGESLGRSVIFLGEHARLNDLPAAKRHSPLDRPRRRNKRVPVDFPPIALGAATIRLFNFFYYRAPRRAEAIVDLDDYFYPLDALQEWNRIYGRRGFLQYQCVLPLATSRAGMHSLIEAIAAARAGSFLAVLKRTGSESFGYLSFPFPGYTLALDFPVTTENLALLDRLDEIMLAHGGRLYFAKDARARPEVAQQGYPRLDRFRSVRKDRKLNEKFQSLQSKRLEI